MLTGRDSLNRLIGKRRRYLPNRESLLSAPIQSSLNLCNDTKNGKIIPDDETEKGYSKAARLVTCPICGSDVPGDNHMINSHLDACLARGTKRKLTQRTLLQLNFSAQTQDQNHSNETKLSTTNVFSEGPVESLEQNSICGLANYVAVEDYNSNHWRSTENTTSHQRINCDEKTPLSSPHINGPEHDVNVTVDGMSEATLQTFIVGRRYSDEKEIKIGAHISLSRDPNNVKDPNAVKVFSADSGCCKVLGYLPKELSEYLSPLMEKYSLSFEGFVISAPKHSLDVAQIKITYHKIESDNENDDDIKVSTCLWKRALHVARSAKGYPSSMIKYQCNFNLLIQEVLGNSRHLFKADEIDFLESFSMLSGDSQRLFVRLYMRKGPWFRLSNISYPEVSNSREAVRELIDNGYIRSSEDTNELHDAIKDICNLLTVSELREISCVLPKNCHRGSRKQKVIASLLCFYEDGICPFLPKMILDRTGLCIRVSSKAEHLIWRAERLFFLNGEQDLSAFLLVDLGIVKYPTYNCIIAEQIFSGLCDLLAYEEAIELAQIMDQSLDENNIELVLRCIMIAESRMSSSSCKAVQSITSELANTFHLCFSASWVYSKVVLLGISFLEREQRFNDAINLLRRLLSCFTCDSRRGYWTLRLSIDLEHMGCPSESLSVAEGGLLDSWVRAGSRVALQRRVLRLGKPPRRWKIPSFSESIKRKITEIHVQGRPLNCEIGMKSWFYGEDGEKCGVEQLALQYYAREGGGWHGVHTESGIWLTIFGLLMWDILFSDVLDVFRSRFQNAPLDLATDSFYIVRKNLIESQLQKIYDGMAEEILITSWESHVGTVCRGVNWDRHSLSELRAAVTCIGGPCLAHLCRHLAQDYGSWSSGMPDLLIWRFHNEYRGEAKLVEVKGPRDRLSEQQRAWLLLLMDCGFKVEVCKVSAQPVST
ncbi:Fanconi-associated nuclease 1-like [Citrus sinensis]|uniref:fanconi-associated nuclease 1 homolog isoform X1 n=1 Tax=Citrus sinensis TaxID=2711 RepID=UPI002195B4DC|nr:fanconi-associated nuclease 1 homolog isoform X1 [Citrus sinensis]KAH9649849.1 Fanconi-associated nuclease 1-like [Citrus sinensis]